MRPEFRTAIAATLLWAACGAAFAQESPTATWKEVAWPFLRDAWPNGRAFECVGPACGSNLSIYARVKNGFCDCSRGVSDDDEIDRVGDVVLVAPDFRPLGSGAARPLAGMDGRARLYETLEPRPRRVLSLAGGRDCNAFVAIAVSAGDIPASLADAAAAFINSPRMSTWIALKQGGQ